MAGTIREDWESFATAVLPSNASAVQRREMRRAFYGGAWAALTLMVDLGEPSVSVDEGADGLDRLLRECVAFNDQIRKGEA